MYTGYEEELFHVEQDIRAWCFVFVQWSLFIHSMTLNCKVTGVLHDIGCLAHLQPLLQVNHYVVVVTGILARQQLYWGVKGLFYCFHVGLCCTVFLCKDVSFIDSTV